MTSTQMPGHSQEEWRPPAGVRGVVTAEWVQQSLRRGRLQRCLAISTDAARSLQLRLACCSCEVGCFDG